MTRGITTDRDGSTLGAYAENEVARIDLDVARGLAFIALPDELNLDELRALHTLIGQVLDQN